MQGFDPDIPYNAREILEKEYKDASDEFDIMVYIIGAIIFFITLHFTQKYSTWDDGKGEDDEIIEKAPLDTTITINDIQFDVSKDKKLADKSQFFNKKGKFYGCLGHDITVCCAKDKFTMELLDKNIDDYLKIV